jgi:hypothetical protein
LIDDGTTADAAVLMRIEATSHSAVFMDSD